jgi:DNA-binding response OmpR family regulator
MGRLRPKKIQSNSNTSLQFPFPEFLHIMRRYKLLHRKHPWLATGTRLDSLSQFYEVAKRVATNCRPEDDLTAVGDVTVNRRTSTITIGNQELVLPRIDAIIFKMLLANAGQVVPRQTLCRCVDDQRELFLTPYIHDLRKKLGKQFKRRIVTAIGQGYMYEYPNSSSSAEAALDFV